jgi:putative SOS response-associated peptidase YedK
VCGRYSLTHPEDVPDLLGPVLDDAALPAEAAAPRYNVAPTQNVVILANRSHRALEMARWGLVPSWAKDLTVGNRMINARGESLAGKPAFREAYARRRCLVPADGFYEWQSAGRGKRAARQPYFIHPVPRRPFAFAGLWDRWRAPDRTWVISFAIVTCPANSLVLPLHDRMPVVIAPEDFDRWLTREPVEPDVLADIVAPADPAAWTAEPVGDWVNRPDHEGPECIESRPAQGLLL